VATSRGIAAFKIDTTGFAKASKDLKGAGPQFRMQMAAGLKEAMQPVLSSAQSHASWSTRIPKTIKISATQSGVSIKAGGAKAPHAAAFENEGNQGSFRHPVFGNLNLWVAQEARPFIHPAITANVDGAMLEKVIAAMDAVFKEAGFI